MPKSKLSLIFQQILGLKKELPEEDEEPHSYKINNYLAGLEIKSDYTVLQGPFLKEDYAIKHCSKYRELLETTYFKINLFANRRFVILTEDITLESRDNERVNLGLLPNNHRLEVFSSEKDFVVVGLDGNILLNPGDSLKIKHLIRKFPFEKTEVCKYGKCLR